MEKIIGCKNVMKKKIGLENEKENIFQSENVMKIKVDYLDEDNSSNGNRNSFIWKVLF